MLIIMIFNSKLLTHDGEGDRVNYLHIMIMMTSNSERLTHADHYPARGRSARARRACALRALGLLLADGALTVGRGKTF